jgi:short subunit dehydrogenase-like uncharacterized protein
MSEDTQNASTAAETAAATWMIYGAYGYTGRLLAERAKAKGLTPILAGRRADALATLGEALGLETRAFALDDPDELDQHIADMRVVVHCAGPFSATAEPMMQACIRTGVHYCDITGEVDVFLRAAELSAEAEKAGVVLCPGVGFDVIPTDCVAARLAEAMPDATQLCLGFDSRSPFSPGTAKTSVEGLKLGNRVRRDGKVVPIGLGALQRRIDFGDGEKHAVAIPWGDVATAFHTTGIGNITVYIPMSPRKGQQLKRLNWLRPILGLGPVQIFLKRKIERSVKGPDAALREKCPTYVWGEVSNAKGEVKQARVITANGYEVTVNGCLMAVETLTKPDVGAGFATPSKLMGSEAVERLPGSSQITIS